ncbi:MAG: PQQ-binding-like beta-propeller repeat protein [Phycisphaerales bacterium]|nr:MAG: PQQ-binding-like beta-propeller repeat protein [Phycisphaerales bacterium]
MMTMYRLPHAKTPSCVGGTILMVLTLTMPAWSAERDLAQEILDQTRIKGGLIVHVGCGDGTLTAALHANDSYLVHGLDTDARNVEQSREHIRSLNLYGKVSVDHWSGNYLPYIDNMVNLIVSENIGDFPIEELVRVLVPEGVAYIREGDSWTKTLKIRPREMDEWTHYLHDASNNPVAHDLLVGPPRRYQWIGSPRWSRHHDHMASMSALVSAGGRLFYIMDEGPRVSIQLPAKWSLVGRDAFNGTVLWKRPMASWNTHKWPLKSGPAQVTRRLVAVDDKVYATLALDAPVTALDAASGQTVRTYTETANTEELIVSDGVILAMVNDTASKWPEYRQKFAYVWSNTNHANRDWAWDERPRHVVAVEADTGKILWRHDAPVAPMTLAADSQGVYFHDGQKLICLDRRSGEPTWQSEPIGRRDPILVCFGPRLIVWKDVVVFAGGDRSMTAVSSRTGKTLWTAEHPRSGHQSPEDLLVVNDLVWSGAIANGRDSGIFRGLDLHTGQIKKEFPPDVDIYWFHHRCYPAKATDQFLLTSRTGIEFIDPQTENWQTHHWVRGGCIYGIMPCNGLIYAPPHSCGCYLQSKLNGFNALAPEYIGRSIAKQVPDRERLQRGPAYEQMRDAKYEAPDTGEWPTYRCDAARSGCTKAAVPTDLKRSWQAEPGGKLSSVVVADGRLFVASVDTHCVHALDADSGKRLWSYTAGGRVDSPPTIWRGRVLFGSADGCVYCLRASDGALAWRFRAAPVDLRMTAYEQVESVWPVHGSVLIQDGALHCVAGRSMFLDGGLHMLKLDPQTGRKLTETILDDRDPETGKNLQSHVRNLIMPVALPDILSSDGGSIYMRGQQFDLDGVRRQLAPLPPDEQTGEGSHLFCQVGFLDDSWFFRSYWIYGRGMGGGYGSWFQAGRMAPSGRIMVFDDDSVYGYARKPEYIVNSSVLEYHLYAADKQVSPESIQRIRRSNGPINAESENKNANSSDWQVRQGFDARTLWAADTRWTQEKLPLHVRAMVLVRHEGDGAKLYTAGPPAVADEKAAFYEPDAPANRDALGEQEAAWEGSKGSLLQVVSASDGEKLAQYNLESVPVWDGMAAANGRLYMATIDGKVVCFDKQ